MNERVLKLPRFRRVGIPNINTIERARFAIFSFAPDSVGMYKVKMRPLFPLKYRVGD